MRRRLLLTCSALAVAAGSLLTAPHATAAEPIRTVATNRDVDGDGRADVIRLRTIDNTRCAVIVETAAGVRDRFVARSVFNPCEWHGAAPIDARRGAEVSVLTLLGAHTPWTTVLTWRDGGLVAESLPRSGGRWAVDAAYNSYAGFERTVTDHGVRMVATTVTATDGRHFSGDRVRYVFRDGAWVRAASWPVTMRLAEADAMSGWHVRGLPRWP